MMLRRSPAQWMRLDPKELCSGNGAQILVCIRDARSDILTLFERVTELDAVLKMDVDAVAEIAAECDKLRAAMLRIAPWLSAATEDPSVCAEMKADIQAFFAAMGDNHV